MVPLKETCPLSATQNTQSKIIVAASLVQLPFQGSCNNTFSPFIIITHLISNRMMHKFDMYVYTCMFVLCEFLFESSNCLNVHWDEVQITFV